MKLIKSKVSEAYLQLGEIFNALELGAFQEGTDFGENVTTSFSWYLSPPALIYLEKHFAIDLQKIKINTRFSCKNLVWQGYKEEGLDIKLVI